MNVWVICTFIAIFRDGVLFTVTIYYAKLSKCDYLLLPNLIKNIGWID